MSGRMRYVPDEFDEIFRKLLEQHYRLVYRQLHERRKPGRRKQE